MSVWQLVIKDKQFQVPERVEVKKYKPRHIVCNGWECYMKKDNAISCMATQEYSEVKYKFMFKIFKNGVIVWLRQKGNEEAEVLRTSKLEEWPVDGIISLTIGFDTQNCVYSYKEATRVFLAECVFTQNNY